MSFKDLFIKLLFMLSISAMVVVLFFHSQLSLMVNIPASMKQLFITLSSTLVPLLTLIVVVYTFNFKLKGVLIGAFVICIYYFIDILLLIYHYLRYFSLDFYFLWYNRSDVFHTLRGLEPSFDSKFLAYIIIFILFGLGVFKSLQLVKKHINHSLKARIINIALFTTVVLLFVYAGLHTETVTIAGQILKPRSNAAALYNDFFIDSINHNKQNIISNKTSEQVNKNLFFIHLESVNSLLVNQKTTPALLSLLKESGMFFNQMQSGSIMTIRSQEVILCSILPSLYESLTESNYLTTDLNCLPKILKKHGYKTLFFQSYPANQDFREYKLASTIGFDEVHSQDIMQPEDILLSWGYDERIFYKRVFDYLEKFKADKLFVYIEVGSVNHVPFYRPELERAYPEFVQSIPFTNPIDTKEIISNSLFIQDQLFGEMYHSLFVPQYGSNTHMVVFGDHSWPAGIHKGNVFNESGAWQENFVTTFGFLPAKNSIESFLTKSAISKLVSQLDIMPTVLDIMHIPFNFFYGNSFYPLLLDETNMRSQLSSKHVDITSVQDGSLKGGSITNNCVISVQPFSGAAIVMIIYPQKQIFDITNNLVIEYNLQEDPNEMVPIRSRTTQAQDLVNLRTCLERLGRVR